MTQEEKTMHYAEQHDIPEVSLSEVKKQVVLSIKAQQYRGVPILVGEAGTGKTQIFKQIAKELDRKLIVIHTASYGITGTGVPSVKAPENATEEEKMNFFRMRVPDIFPKQGDKAIILFDEINRGAKHAINMFFNLLEDRRMYNYVLPEDCLVCGTMNPATKGYNVTEIAQEPAIRRRVKFYYVVDSFVEFISHAKSKAFHAFSSVKAAKGRKLYPALLSYYEAKPTAIYDVKARDAGKQYTCPANIETLSEDCYLMESLGVSLVDSDAEIRLAASVGVGEAKQIVAHIYDNNVTVSATDVLNNFSKKTEKKVKHMLDSKPEPLVELTTNIGEALLSFVHDNRLTDQVVNNLLRFCHLLSGDMLTFLLQDIKEKSANQNISIESLMKLLTAREDWVSLMVKIQKTHDAVSFK